MIEALKEAKKAFKKNEVPVGAVIVRNGKILAKSHNDRQKKHKVTGHAEINAILRAENKIKDWRLDDCEMFVTLAPCKMCSAIIKEVRIKNTYYLLPSGEENDFLKIDGLDTETIQYENVLKKFFESMR